MLRQTKLSGGGMRANNYSDFPKNNGNRKITVVLENGEESSENSMQKIRRFCVICNSAVGLAEKYVVIENKAHHLHCSLPISQRERDRVHYNFKKEYNRLKISEKENSGFLSDIEFDNWESLKPIFEE